MRSAGRLKETLAQHDLAIETLELAAGEADPDAIRELARTRMDRGMDLEGLGLPKGAVGDYERAIALFERLSDGSEEGAAEVDGDLAAAEATLGDSLRRLGRPPEALDAYGRAIELLRRRQDDVDLPRALTERGKLLHDLHRFEEASEDLASAIEILVPQADFERSTNDVLRKLGGECRAEIGHALARARMLRGAALRSRERLEEARDEVDGAVAVWAAAVEEGMAYLIPSLLEGVAIRLGLHCRLGRWADAAGDVRLAARMASRHPGGAPPVESIRVLASLRADERAAVAARLGDLAPQVAGWLAGR